MRDSFRFTGVAWLVLSTLSFSQPAAAQYNPHQPKILLHLTTPSSKGDCTTNFTNSLSLCGDAVTNGISSPDGSRTYFVYIVVARGDSLPNVGAVRFGIQYDQGSPDNRLDGSGIDLFSYTRCTTSCLECNQWPVPAPGTGATLVWDCQTGPIANAGYFYIAAYSPGSFLEIVPHPSYGVAQVADCQGLTVDLPGSALGSVRFSPAGTVNGCNPCLGPCPDFVPAVPTTWSRIKARSLGTR